MRTDCDSATLSPWNRLGDAPPRHGEIARTPEAAVLPPTTDDPPKGAAYGDSAAAVTPPGVPKPEKPPTLTEAELLDSRRRCARLRRSPGGDDTDASPGVAGANPANDWAP